MYHSCGRCASRLLTLRMSLMKIPLLHYVRQGKDFILDIDASQHAVGAVLNQMGDQGEVHLAIVSKICTTQQW